MNRTEALLKLLEAYLEGGPADADVFYDAYIAG